MRAPARMCRAPNRKIRTDRVLLFRNSVDLFRAGTAFLSLCNSESRSRGGFLLARCSGLLQPLLLLPLPRSPCSRVSRPGLRLELTAAMTVGFLLLTWLPLLFPILIILRTGQKVRKPSRSPRQRGLWRIFSANVARLRPHRNALKRRLTSQETGEIFMGGPIISGGKPWLEAACLLLFISLLLFSDPQIDKPGWMNWLRHFLGLSP